MQQFATFENRTHHHHHHLHQQHSVTPATVSSSELMRGNAQRGQAVPLRPKPGSYNGPLKKGGLCPLQHEQVPL